MNWLIWYLAGTITGLIGGVLIDKDTVIKYIVRKIKIKKSPGVSDVVDIEIKDLREKKRELRRERRQTRNKAK